MEPNSFLVGSICLTDIPRDVMKRVACKDGKDRIYVNVAVMARKKPQSFTNADGTERTYTHFLTCAPQEDKRIEGVNYFIGDFEMKRPTPKAPTVDDIYAAPPIPPNYDLPF